MDNLPQEIVLDLFSRLPISSLMLIKCVCKAWRVLVQDPRLAVLFHARSSNRNPCLILHRDCLIQNSLYYVGASDLPLDLFDNKVRRIDSRLHSIMPEYQVVGSCNGLLCLSDALYVDPICICNPFTGHQIVLPKATQNPYQVVALGFGYHPITMEHKVVKIAYYGDKRHLRPYMEWVEESDVQVFTLGMDAWRSLGKAPWRVDALPSEALLNGMLHWVTMRHLYPPGPSLHIISFDLAEEKFGEVELPTCGSLTVCNFHLVVLRGSLSAAVCRHDRQVEIWIMKEYKVKESWSKEYVIGTYVPRITVNARPKSRIWKKPTLSKGAIQVVTCLKEGEILLEHEGCALVSYNPETGEFREQPIGMPKWFSTTIHMESLFHL